VTVHQSCFADLSEEEFACGVEIPIGEVIDRSAFLAFKMEEEFDEIIKETETEIAEVEKLIASGTSCGNLCKTGCLKDRMIWGKFISGPSTCSSFPGTPAEIKVSCCEEAQLWCGNCLEPCDQCQCVDETYCWYCWEETQGAPPVTCYYCQEGYPYDEKIRGKKTPDSPGNCNWYSKKEVADSSLCQYCEIETQTECQSFYGQDECCQEECTTRSCRGPDKSGVANSCQEIEKLEESLKNSIGETDQPEKFEWSSILNQLKFARCELSKCYISAEEYPKVMTGEMAGKHLFTCKMVQEMGLLEDDQIACIAFQALKELEEAESASSGFWAVIKGFFKALWYIVKTWLTGAREEGCFPTNYYCCQM